VGRKVADEVVSHMTLNETPLAADFLEVVQVVAADDGLQRPFGCLLKDHYIGADRRTGRPFGDNHYVCEHVTGAWRAIGVGDHPVAESSGQRSGVSIGQQGATAIYPGMREQLSHGFKVTAIQGEGILEEKILDCEVVVGSQVVIPFRSTARASPRSSGERVPGAPAGRRPFWRKLSGGERGQCWD
jgi:hypothetical protein